MPPIPSPQRRSDAAALVPTSAGPAAKSRELAALDGLASGAVAELAASGYAPGYSAALRRLTLMLQIPCTDVQVRAIALRLHANGHTPEDAEWAVDRLADDPAFGEQVHRFKSPLLPAHLLGVLALRPGPDDRYTEADVARLARQLSLDRAAFVRVEPSHPVGLVYAYRPAPPRALATRPDA